MNEVTKYKAPTGHELSTEVESDYFIIFNDDVTKRISRERAEAVMQASGGSSKFFQLDGAMFNFSNIARLIPVSEYYQEFPDERPPEHHYPKIEPPDEPGVGYARRLLSSEQITEKFLKIWRDQRNSPDYVRVTGGLDGLIAWGEQRLAKFKAEKVKTLELRAEIDISGEEQKPKPRPRTRSDVLREARERRGLAGLMEM